nr:tyrosine-type recombinase/integrase [Petrocella atlantisensis]
MARLGLRSSDVANLRFTNIDWENELIRLTQMKTGNPLELPLLQDVGEAMIHYLKGARPKSESDHVLSGRYRHTQNLTQELLVP